MFVYIQAIRCLVNGCVSFFLNLIGQRQLRRLAIFISTFVSQLSLILSNKHGCPCWSCSIPIQKKMFYAHCSAITGKGKSTFLCFWNSFHLCSCDTTHRLKLTFKRVSNKKFVHLQVSLPTSWSEQISFRSTMLLINYTIDIWSKDRDSRFTQDPNYSGNRLMWSDNIIGPIC